MSQHDPDLRPDFHYAGKGDHSLIPPAVCENVGEVIQAVLPGLAGAGTYVLTKSAVAAGAVTTAGTALSTLWAAYHHQDVDNVRSRFFNVARGNVVVAAVTGAFNDHVMAGVVTGLAASATGGVVAGVGGVCAVLIAACISTQKSARSRSPNADM